MCICNGSQRSTEFDRRYRTEHCASIAVPGYPMHFDRQEGLLRVCNSAQVADSELAEQPDVHEGVDLQCVWDLMHTPMP